jgi:hypothetical protein
VSNRCVACTPNPDASNQPPESQVSLPTAGQEIANHPIARLLTDGLSLKPPRSKEVQPWLKDSSISPASIAAILSTATSSYRTQERSSLWQMRKRPRIHSCATRRVSHMSIENRRLSHTSSCYTYPLLRLVSYRRRPPLQGSSTVDRMSTRLVKHLIWLNTRQIRLDYLPYLELLQLAMTKRLDPRRERRPFNHDSCAELSSILNHRKYESMTADKARSSHLPRCYRMPRPD